MPARITLLAVVLSIVCLFSSACTTDFGQAQQGSNGQSSDAQTGGATALLSQLSSGSLGLSNIGNAAGVIGYCYKKNYVAGPGQRVKNKLTNLIGGQQQAEKKSDYQNGLAGMLEGKKGQKFSLTNLKDTIGKRVCQTVVDTAKSSFLGS